MMRVYTVIVPQSCPWVGLTRGLGWVESGMGRKFVFLVGWVGNGHGQTRTGGVLGAVPSAAV